MKVESNMAWATSPVQMKVTATKRIVAIEIHQLGFGGGIIAMKMTRDDAQRLADTILAAMKEQS